MKILTAARTIFTISVVIILLLISTAVNSDNDSFKHKSILSDSILNKLKLYNSASVKTPSKWPPECGDVNGDGVIDVDDLVDIFEYYIDINYTFPNDSIVDSVADLDYCKGVDINDFVLWANLFSGIFEPPYIDCGRYECSTAIIDSIYLDHISPQSLPGTLPVGKEISFFIRLSAGESNNNNYMDGLSNGFKVFSPDGAEWSSTGLIPLSGIDEIFYWINYPVFKYDFELNNDGIESDTVAFLDFAYASGLPPNFNGLIYEIKIGPISSEHVGKTIVLDSSFFGHYGSWMVSRNVYWGIKYIPAWGGPYEFTIVPCCQGMRGEIDGNDIINIDDVIYLVEYMFGFPSGPEPFCFEEADVDASGLLDIDDLVTLVEYSFSDPPGPTPQPCPTY